MNIILDRPIKISEIDALRQLADAEEASRQTSATLEKANSDAAEAEIAFNEAQNRLAQMPGIPINPPKRRELFWVEQKLKRAKDPAFLSWEKRNLDSAEIASLENEVNEIKKYNEDNEENFAKIEALSKARDEAVSIRVECEHAHKEASATAFKASERNEQARKKVQDIRGRISTDLLDLPEDLSVMLRSITYGSEQFDAPSWTTIPHEKSDLSCSTIAGILRGELPYRPYAYDPVAWWNEEGVPQLLLESIDSPDVKMELVFDRDRDPLHSANPDYYAEKVRPIVPKSHYHLSLHSLEPWARSPVPVEIQAKQIESVVSLPDDLRSWILLGQAGTSKTAFVSAWLKDEITRRAYFNGGEICTWRIKVNRWLDHNLEWMTRDFSDQSIQRPDLSIQAIEEACDESGLRPIVWIEEFDKYQPSKRRSDLIDSLIDAIYEMNGMIIITSNHTQASLRDYVSPATLRRLTGSHDEKGKFFVWDFHQIKLGK
jgi:hypothetical protein